MPCLNGEAHEGAYMGALGCMHYFRCINCGIDYGITQEEFDSDYDRA